MCIRDSLYGDLVIKDAELELPSSDIQDYNFVLQPLAEIAPDLVHPTLKKNIEDLLTLDT